MSIKKKIGSAIIGFGLGSLFYFGVDGLIVSSEYIYKTHKNINIIQYDRSTPKSLVRMLELEKELNKNTKLIQVDQHLVDKINRLKKERYNLEISCDYQRDKKNYYEEIKIICDYKMQKDLLAMTGSLALILLGHYFKTKESNENK